MAVSTHHKLPEDAIYIDREAEDGLQMQLRQSIAQSVLAGRLLTGDRMPSSRKLARHLGISRITVTLAYQELVADGYLVSRDRSGYFVAETAPTALPVQQRRRDINDAAPIDWQSRFARPAPTARLVERPVDWRDYRYPFIYGQTDPDLFSHSAWRACAYRALGRRDFATMTGDFVAEDDPELVDFIARQTLPRRGIAAGPDEILITMGAQNALWLVSELLLGPGKTAVMENPGYPGLRDILARSGARLLPVDVDADGLPPASIPAETDVAFVTPSHQAPTTVTMPMARRRALIAQAAAQDFVLVEDDYEYELAFLRAPYPALRSIDASGRVIYVGSFSKSIFPGLRLGYMVGPPDLIAEARKLRAALLRHPPGHLQRTTAYFLALGHYDALMRRLRDAFQVRRARMMEGIATGGLTAEHGALFGGTSFWMRAPDGVDARHLAETLRPLGVVIENGEPFFAEAPAPCPHYRLAYSSIPLDRIGPGLEIIADAGARLALGSK